MKPALVRIARSLSFVVLASTLALGLPATEAVAQQGVTSGSIGGVVLDPDGQPRANVVVRVTDLERGVERQTLTDAQGRYGVGLLQSGTYSVRAEFPPLQPVEVGPVRVSIGERTLVNLGLQPIEAEELRVTVGPGVADIDVTQGGVVQLIDDQQVSELPTSGRDFTDFIALSGLVSPQSIGQVRQEAGTGGQFSILGARSSTSNITIDGVDANNQFFGENRGSSRLPFTFSLGSIKEFQIITSGYDVEYGRFAGGQINAVTKGGTNEVSGEGWFFGRDEALTADNFDGTPAANFQSLQFGGRLSGPIVRDKLHFFVSGDFQQQDQPAFALDPTRADIPAGVIAEVQDIFRDVYGFDQATIDEMFGVSDQTDDQSNIFARLDWSISPDHRLTLRGNYSNFESLNDEISTSGRESLFGGAIFESENLSIVGELNSVLGRNVFNTLRFQYADEDRPRTPNSFLPQIGIESIPTNTPDVETTIDVGGTAAGISFANRLQEEKFQITENLNFQLGDHLLKVGTDDIFTSIKNDFWLFGNGLLTFSNLDDFREGISDFFLRAVSDLDNPEPPFTSFDMGNYSFYVQDEWQASDKLRLLFGLRWDWQDFQNAPLALDDPDFQDDLDRAGIDPTAVPDDKNNWGPRFSFAYDTRGDAREIVRGGVGLFYDDILAVVHGNTLINNPDPLLFNVCIAGAAPDSLDLLAINADPSQIPNTCKEDFVDRESGFAIGFDPFGIGIIGAPDVAVWDPETENPQTLRANLGYERRLGNRWKVGATGIFSRTWNLFRGQQLTQAEMPFFTQADGRPVWTEEDGFDPEDNTEDDATQAEDLRLLLFQTDGADARAFSVNFDVQGAPTNDLRVGASWTTTVSKDNNSKECCTAFALTTEIPTAGNMNFLGEPGDTDVGAWGPSRNERRHVVILNWIWQLPAGFQVSGIYRGQSGLPFTPGVFGDLNGDGIDENDRPFLPDPSTAAPGDPLNLDGLQFASQADLDAYTELLNEESCLREAVGTIINRNTCRDPWWHSVDLKFKKAFRLRGTHNFEVIADLFNVLDGLGIGAGEFTFKRANLFSVPEEGDVPDNFDDVEREVVVETLDFGREIPAGFTPFQFQAQLGLRYRF